MSSAVQGAFDGFSPAAFTFLRGLARNNRKDWFEARRDTYETVVRAPMRAFVDEVDAILGEAAPEFRGDPKRSVFRIHRDVRFSKDKSPYKTNVACWLFHQDAGHGVGLDAHGGAGYYLNVEPGRCLIGGGVWMPAKPALDRIRDRIADDHKRFTAIISAPAVRKRFGALSDEAMLTRVPRGYDPDHPAAHLLRHKSFTLDCALPDSAVQSRGLLKTVKRDVELLLPFVRWLNEGLGLGARRNR